MQHTRERRGRLRAGSMIGAAAVLAIAMSACGGGGREPAQADVAPSVDLTTFASPIYGYSIGYPSTWTVRKAEHQISPTGYPDVDNPGIDYFSQIPPDEPDRDLLSLAVGVAGPAVPDGTTLDDWAADVEQAHRDLLPCASADAREDIEVGGEPGRILTWKDCPAFLLWAVVVHDGHAFHLWLVDSNATGNQATQMTDRVLLEKILASFTFTS